MTMLKAAISGQTTRNSHSLVVDALGRAIVGGDYARGATLPGDFELANRFAVSRTVLREAMKTLAAKGMIVARARIGTRVTDRSTWNYFDADVLRWHLDIGADSRFMTHLAEMRLAFEPYAARLACRHATPKDIEQMLVHADAMENADSQEGFALADLAFHLALAEASKNPFMYSVGSLVEAALVTSFRLSSPFGEATRQSLSAAAHRRIAQAIAERDEMAAAAAVELVITEGRDRVDLKLAHT